MSPWDYLSYKKTDKVFYFANPCLLGEGTKNRESQKSSIAEEHFESFLDLSNLILKLIRIKRLNIFVEIQKFLLLITSFCQTEN